jgi:hypothetical protein
MTGKNIFNDLDKLDEFIKQETEKIVREHGIGFSSALREFLSRDPQFMRLREQLYVRQEAEDERLGVEDAPESVAASEAAGPRLALLMTAAPTEAEKLTRIPVAALVRGVLRGVKFAIDRAGMTALIENFRKRTTPLEIDYEHASEKPEVAKGGPLPAAGWLRQIDDGPDGLGILWGLAEFTETARKLIAEKAYQFISPAVQWVWRDKGSGELRQGTRLSSIALTNRPFLENLPALALSEAGWNVGKETRPRKVLMTDRAAGTVSVTMYEIDQVDAELRRRVEEKLKANPKLTHGQALKMVLSEDPDLTNRREALMRE